MWLVVAVATNLLIIAGPFVLVGLWQVEVVTENLEMIVSALTGLSTTVWSAWAVHRGIGASGTVGATRPSEVEPGLARPPDADQ